MRRLFWVGGFAREMFSFITNYTNNTRSPALKANIYFSKKCLILLSMFSSLLIAISTQAQIAESNWRTENYDWQLGVPNSGSFRGVSFDHVVRSEGAAWIKINFKDAYLGKESFVEIVSLGDGAKQILDAKTLVESNFSSAYFNGDEVNITLHVAEGESDISLAIDSIDVGEHNLFTAFSQCGPNDDRISSNDAAIGRIMPIGCTGWLIDNRKVLTAGHCIRSSTVTLQFNVPSSNANGGTVNPGPEDQYTIIQDSIVFRNNGVGNDWAVLDVQNNSQTGLHPIEAQGKSFSLVQNHSADTIRITGFGVDTGSSNQTQQTHTGPLRSASGTSLNYAVDTEGGNSGSPVIDESTGNAIGIHTHGGCSVSGGGNSGTSTLNSAFWSAADVDVNTDPNKVGITQILSTSTTTANRRAMPFVVSSSGFLTSITMYHAGGSGKMQLGVYADSNGLPGALISETQEVDTSANTGWQTVQLQNAASVSEGQSIWLAWVYENNPGIFYDSGSPGRANINQTWDDNADNMPATFGNSTTADFRYSIYATLSEDGGGSDDSATVGIDTIGSQTSTNGSRRAAPYVMPEDGDLESISIYHEGGSGGLILAVYADNNGAPGELLASTGEVQLSSSAGWQSAALPADLAPIQSGEAIWLAWVFENNPGIRYVSGSPGRAQSSEDWSGGMPNSFGVSEQSSFLYSIYATYTK